MKIRDGGTHGTADGEGTAEGNDGGEEREEELERTSRRYSDPTFLHRHFQ